MQLDHSVNEAYDENGRTYHCTSLFSIIFSAWISATEKHKLVLRKLHLRHWYFDRTGALLPRVIDCGRLSTLIPQQCTDVDALANEIYQSKSNLQFFANEEETDMSRVGMLETMLRSVSGLRTVRFLFLRKGYLHGDRSPAASTRHCESLNLVCVDDATPDRLFRFREYDRSLPAFREFCKAATNLQQLAMPSAGNIEQALADEKHSTGLPECRHLKQFVRRPAQSFPRVVSKVGSLLCR